jgi:hypothetical protein
MDLPISKLLKAEVFGGMYGHITVRNNAGAAGVDIGTLDNGTIVLIPDRTKLDATELKNNFHEGWCQVANLLNDDIFRATENWVEESHVRAVIVEPPPPEEGEWVHYEWKFENGQLYLRKMI